MRFGRSSRPVCRPRATRLIQSLALAALVGAGVASAAGRVVGGTMIQIQSAPWTVSVRYDFGSSAAVCTGSVLDASHILTAAHCLYDPSGILAQPSSVSVQAGVSNFASPISTDLEQDRSVSSFRVHPDYAHSTTFVPDDVAVLALATPLDLSGPAVRAVALPTPQALFPAGAAVIIAGFGLQDPTAQYVTGPLASMTATVDPQGRCGENTQSTFFGLNNGVVLCSASPASALCSGDSGSGVVTTGATPVLVAVANAGPSACPVGNRFIATYVGAPEILRFIQGDDRPPIAPRPAAETIPYRLSWDYPLVVGDTLTCSAGGWPASVQISYSFVNAANGDVLQAGPNASYLLPPETAGTTIVCETALTNSGGTTLVDSNSTSMIAAVPRVKIERLPPLAAKRGQTITLHVVLVSPPGLSGKFSVCATLPASVGGHLCRSTHKPFGASGNFPFTLSLRIKPTAPLGVAHVAIIATAGMSTAATTALLRIAKP
jgi:hypothetical protein